MNTKPCKTDVTIPTYFVTAHRERVVRPHYLEMEEEGGRQRIPLDREQIIIGRADEANIRIPSQRASRHHAIISRQGLEYVIRDNDSRNGVFLNGVKIHSAVLRDGDVLQIAHRVFVYYEG